MNGIKISILIRTYNRAKLLKKCIDSVLNTEFSKDNYEIIVGDGASTDSTQENMLDLIEKSKKFPNDYPHIYYFRDSENLGLVRNILKPISFAKGKYICLLDSDATVPKDWLKKVHDLMEAKDLDLSGASHLTYPEEGPLVGYDLGPFGEIVLPYRKNEPIFISGVNLFFKKSTFYKVGGLDPMIDYASDDLDLALRVRFIGGKVMGNTNIVVDHTNIPTDEHLRAPNNIEKFLSRSVSRVIYTYLKDFEWRYGIKLAFRYFLIKTYDAFIELGKKNQRAFIGYLKGIYWILLNFGIIIKKHMRVKRLVKGSDILKKFLHQKSI
ncbi:MAG: glycosyltransferase family 2 protein [Candidatus Hodarchaeota archaeon]